MRSSILAVAVLAVWWTTPASAQGLKFFYCYAVNATTGTVFFSDMHEVGPVPERASYGVQFSSYLSGTGKIPSGAQGYCVMAPKASDIERAQRGLASESCPECGDATKFEQIAWSRAGVSPGIMLAGGPPGSKTESIPTPGRDPIPAKEGAEPHPGAGVYMLGRMDEADVVFTANEERGLFLTRHKADLKGGRWVTILADDRCPGWVAVASASDGVERAYYVARGAESEGDARRLALGYADRAVEYKQGDWNTEVLRAFQNDYRPPSGFDASKGIIKGLAKELGNALGTKCAESKRLTTWGVRG